MVTLVGGCEGRLSTLQPAGPAAEAIAGLWWVLLGGSAVLFLFTMGLLAAAARPRAGTLPKGREGLWLGGLGIAFPLAVLGALLVWALVVGERLLPRTEPDLVTVRAEARQWAWAFSYADAPGRVTEGVLHIPAGQPVDVEITSRDVVHSFWVPRLAGKLDAIPGHINVLRIEAWEPGEFDGLSAEFSGRGYREHGFRVQAHDASGWAAFLAGDMP